MGTATVGGKRNTLSRRNLVIVIALVILYIIIANIPNDGASLSMEGQKILALMVVTIIAWIFEVIPIGLMAMVALMLQIPLGIMDMSARMVNFGQNIFFFVIGCFGIASAMRRSGLGTRLMLAVTILSRGNAKKMLFMFMALCAFISMFISDVAITAMLFPIALAILKENGMEPGKSRYGKAMMLGIPIAALIGGIGTPAGAPMNYLALSLLEQAVGMQITFLQWTCIGVPIVFILTPIAWFILVKMLPPEKEQLEGAEEAKLKYQQLGRLTSAEWKFIIIFIITLIFWLAEPSWLPLPVTSFFSGVLFFLPGININDASVLQKDVDWNVLMLNVCSAGLGAGVLQTGAAAWLANGVLGGLNGMNPIVIMIAISLFTVFIHLVCPVNTALVSILVPAIAVMSTTMGISPALVVLPVAFTTSCAMLFPLDTVPALTLSTGYYKMTEMFKPGVVISLAWVAVQTIVVLVLFKPLGF